MIDRRDLSSISLTNSLFLTDKTRNVQVTLKILRALIDKSPRDLPLYSPYVLRILKLILQSHDLNMVEDSIPTFEMYCEHYDMATLASDQQHIRQFEDVIRSYAGYAITVPASKSAPSTPVAIRWKSAALQSIKALSSSEAVGVDSGRLLGTIVPMILHNIYSEHEDYLAVLQQRAYASEKSEKELALKRRMSIATVRTSDTKPDNDTAAVAGSTADADRLAEEEVGLLALQSLKQLFEVNNRLQIRLSTAAMLRFILSKVTSSRPATARSSRSVGTASWATSLLEVLARWTPVQDRFVMLVTSMETLIRSPISEENLEQQLVLASLIGSLLSSNINMIGLSVMDVLLGLVQHILLLLQLGGKGSNVLPHPQQTDAIDLFKDSEAIVTASSPTGNANQNGAKDAVSPSLTRQELLVRLQKCIGDLATHIYYSDQISDMIIAILLRLKPSPQSGISSTAAAIERPAAAAQAISNSVNLQEDPNTDDFFSFGTARVTALMAIKEILTVANLKGSATGAAAVGRNRVSVQVWEGTQWLLRDEDRRVRRAYVDALLTWLRLEMSKTDLRVVEDKRHIPTVTSKTNTNMDRTESLTRRAVSSASQKGKITKPPRSTFLQLLHLAIYDNALESPETEADILLLHLLLTHLTEKLGVNAVKSGLPMIRRLQEDINDDDLVSTPTAKMNIGSLVHGNFWAVTEKFELESTMVGYEIHSEISRRQKHGLWLDGIRIPPLPLGQIVSTVPTSSPQLPPEVVREEALKPFDSHPALVEQIALAYANSVSSPPASPPSSPGRVFSLPVISPTGSLSSTKHELPAVFKESMLSDWSKELCIATVEKENAPTASLHGSRSGTNRSPRNGLLTANGHTPRDSSPAGFNPSPRISIAKRQNQEAQAALGSPALLPLSQGPYRRSSIQDTGPPTPISSSDHQPTLRIDDLKRVLAGGALADALSRRKTTSSVRGASPLRNSSTAYQDFGTSGTNHTSVISAGSDSVVDAEGFESASEGDLSRPLPPPQPALDSTTLADEYLQQLPRRPFDHSPSGARERRPSSGELSKGRPRTSSSASEDPDANARALKGELVPPVSRGSGVSEEEDVPPVPPLPASLSRHPNTQLGTRLSSKGSTGNFSRPTTAPVTERGDRHSLRATGDGSWRGSDRGSLQMVGGEKRAKIQMLLSEIEVGEKGMTGVIGKGMGRPPY